MAPREGERSAGVGPRDGFVSAPKDEPTSPVRPRVPRRVRRARIVVRPRLGTPPVIQIVVRR